MYIKGQIKTMIPAIFHEEVQSLTLKDIYPICYQVSQNSLGSHQVPALIRLLTFQLCSSFHLSVSSSQPKY